MINLGPEVANISFFSPLHSKRYRFVMRFSVFGYLHGSATWHVEKLPVNELFSLPQRHYKPNAKQNKQRVRSQRSREEEDDDEDEALVLHCQRRRSEMFTVFSPLPEYIYLYCRSMF